MTIERRVRIVQDVDGFDPRTDCNVGRMLCWHRNYDLGDKHNYDRDTWKQELACQADVTLEEVIDFVEDTCWTIWHEEAGVAGSAGPADFANAKVEKAVAGLIDSAFDANYIALPLGLHDHGGISMYVGGGGCVGVIVCTKQQVQDEWAGDEDKAEKYLRSEVETYDHYLRGNVWGYILEEREYGGCNCCNRPNEWDNVDSCWGFIGNMEDMESEVPAGWEDEFRAGMRAYR